MKSKKTKPTKRYFVNDDGGYASGYGAMADAFLKLPGWRETAKAEHDKVQRACPDSFADDIEVDDYDSDWSAFALDDDQ